MHSSVAWNSLFENRVIFVSGPRHWCWKPLQHPGPEGFGWFLVLIMQFVFFLMWDKTVWRKSWLQIISWELVWWQKSINKRFAFINIFVRLSRFAHAGNLCISRKASWLTSRSSFFLCQCGNYYWRHRRRTLQLTACLCNTVGIISSHVVTDCIY